jgi:hypothetical protein
MAVRTPDVHVAAVTASSSTRSQLLGTCTYIVALLDRSERAARKGEDRFHNDDDSAQPHEGCALLQEDSATLQEDLARPPRERAREGQGATAAAVLDTTAALIAASPVGQLPTYLRIKHQLIERWVAVACGSVLLVGRSCWWVGVASGSVLLVGRGC